MLEFFYDCSSPWTYLAFDTIQKLGDELGVTVAWRPFLVGGVFNTINPSVYHQREHPIPAKQRYMAKDLDDWAALQGLSIRFPPSIFPVNSARAMRACIVADGLQKLVPFSRRVFEAYWSEDRDIASEQVLLEIAGEVGIDGPQLLGGASSPETRAALRANTDEVIARGGFGSPTIFVAKTDMYFGNDRAVLIRLALEKELRVTTRTSEPSRD
jgi:2-hydroxychromene-2-carboxylate isomerase